MKAERDDLVLRIPSASETPVELCVFENLSSTNAGIQLASCLTRKRSRLTHHCNDSLASRGSVRHPKPPAPSSHRDQLRSARTVTSAADPIPPHEKVANDLHGDAGALNIPQVAELLLTDYRVFSEHNKVINLFLPKELE